MTEYALVSPANVVDRYASNVDPTVQTRAGWRWLPVEATDPGVFDGATQVKEGPTVSVLSDKVTRVWTVRAKTAQELDDDKEATLDRFAGLMLKIAFNHENRVRVLEAKAPVTAVQFRAALKALL